MLYNYVPVAQILLKRKQKIQGLRRGIYVLFFKSTGIPNRIIIEARVKQLSYSKAT